MRVQMKRQISGTRDGESWPPPGEQIDLPDDEATQLLAADLADPADPADGAADKPVRGGRKTPEKRPAPSDPETRES